MVCGNGWMKLTTELQYSTKTRLAICDHRFDKPTTKWNGVSITKKNIIRLMRNGFHISFLNNKKIIKECIVHCINVMHYAASEPPDCISIWWWWMPFDLYIESADSVKAGIVVHPTQDNRQWWWPNQCEHATHTHSHHDGAEECSKSGKNNTGRSHTHQLIDLAN